jgi:hypothetical protein
MWMVKFVVLSLNELLLNHMEWRLDVFINDMLYAKTLHSAHRVHMCVPYGSHDDQRIFS